MSKIKILVDSTADLNNHICEKYDIECIPMTFSINRKNYEADLDWNTISPSNYYNSMRLGNRAITGLIKINNLINAYDKYLKDGYDIIYIACSSKLSSSLNNAKIIALDYIDKYPNNRIICFDSLRSNASQGLMAIDASKMINQGKSTNEIITYLLENRLKYQTYATVDSLEWLKKAGRVKASTAFLSDLLSVKPIIMGDQAGYNRAFKKVKGRKASLNALAKLVKDRLDQTRDKYIIIEHADSLDDALYVKSKILEKINDAIINISDLGPIIGATTGPDTITVSFYGNKGKKSISYSQAS